jgi:hypothetical protein
MAAEPLADPEVTTSLESCVADWGSVRVHMHCLRSDETRDWDRRAESWRQEPGFVSLRAIDLAGDPAAAPRLTGDVESALTAAVAARLPASPGCVKSDD